MENPKQPYKIATLFSGAGGLDTGFTKTEKFENQIANDKLDAPSLTYQKNHSTMRIQTVANFNEDPKLPCYIVGDVTDVNFEPLNNIDCVIGGPPCQDFSQVRGSRDDLGITKVRGKLYSHFIRALTKAAPKIFVFENVPGLVSSNGGLAYTTIVNDFENLNEKWTEIKNELKKGPDSANNYSLIFNGIVNSSKKKETDNCWSKTRFSEHHHDNFIPKRSKRDSKGKKVTSTKIPNYCNGGI